MAAIECRAMGTTCHLEVWVAANDPTGEQAGRVLEGMTGRLRELEARWSRFIPGSDVSRMNRHAGVDVPVSTDTTSLVAQAISAWELTGGHVDPTVLHALETAGYPPSGWFSDAPTTSGSRHSTRVVPGPQGIVVDADVGTVFLPTGVGFDPGGIGKGRAVDLLVDWAHAAGAQGVCADLGGDVKVSGTGSGPERGSWCVAVDHGDGFIASVIFDRGTAGAVATSSVLARRWDGPEGAAHHLIDPRSGRPSTSDLVAVSVVGAEAMWAEVVAKAAVIAGSSQGRVLVEQLGLSALASTVDGSVLRWGSIDSFLATSQPHMVQS